MLKISHGFSSLGVDILVEDPDFVHIFTGVTHMFVKLYPLSATKHSYMGRWSLFLGKAGEIASVLCQFQKSVETVMPTMPVSLGSRQFLQGSSFFGMLSVGNFFH